MRIRPVPCLKDNYAYLVICEATSTAAVVDPSQAKPVLAAASEEGVELVAIWNTHHHWDHTAGNKKLISAHPRLEVIGHVSDKGRIDGQSSFVEDGEVLQLGDEIEAHIIFNPGHTSGAISYHIPDPGAVFTGDTLFGGGCGRLFEGSPEEMLASLSRLAALPESTEVYCGHEYTANNLKFAALVEPDSAPLAKRRATVEATRERDEFTVPFTVAEERATNPFLRTTVVEVAESARRNEDASASTPTEVFAALRRWKDRF